MNATLEPANLAPPYQEDEMARKAKVLIHAAIDLWLGELARQGRAQSTLRKYRDVLDPFGDHVRPKAPDEITADDVRTYLDRWTTASASTLALYVTVLRRFFAFLEDEEIVRRSPAERLKRPLRKRAEDLDVITLTPGDAGRLLRACEDWQELICLSVLAYTGIRRKAAANARRRDANLDTGTLRVVEKGGKVQVKPLPGELLLILRRAHELGQWASGEDWLIPNRKPWLVRDPKRRGSRIVYDTVRRVADRAGMRAHVHAFRGAFAVAFDEAHPDLSLVLQDLLGHARLDTTRVYLRRRDKAAGMEAVRDLSFGFPANDGVPPAGFEPAFRADPDAGTAAPVAGGVTLADELLGRARDRAEAVERGRRVDASERV